MKPSKTIEGPLRTAILAGLFVVVAAAIIMIWAGQQLIGVSGATDLASDAQGNIWLALNGKLERLSANGAIEKSFDLEQLGIGTPNAIVPMPDGNVWVGSLDHERLFLLSPAGKQLAQAAPPASVGPIYGTFHAAYEPTSDRLVVADTQNHRLLAFTGEGEFVAASGLVTGSALPQRHRCRRPRRSAAGRHQPPRTQGAEAGSVGSEQGAAKATRRQRVRAVTLFHLAGLGERGARWPQLRVVARCRSGQRRGAGVCGRRQLCARAVPRATG